MLPLLVLLSSVGAQAADWSDFSGAFPVAPCPDGWVACIIGGTRVDPEPQRDSTGAPMPSDVRVSWFDLAALPGFDPFAGLSRYPENPPAPVVAQPDPPRVAGAPLEGVTPPDLTPPEVVAVVEQGVVDPVPAVQPDPVDDDGVAAIPDEASDPMRVPPAAGCELDEALFGRARTGKLSVGERACLDDRARNATTQTQRSKASRPLIADAFARSDKGEWAKLVKRHLDEIERSDPALAMSYAKHLARGGPKNAEGVLYWSEVALENRTIWQGDLYVRRTLALRRMKAKAAGARWQQLERAKASGESVDPGTLQKWRTDTRTFAKEWYDYSVAAGKPDDRGLALCASAARSDDACR